MKKGVLTNFTKFTGKHLCQSLLFNKVTGLRPATLLKKRLWHRCFPVNFVKFLRTPFFIEHLWWLPLQFLRNLVETQKLCRTALINSWVIIKFNSVNEIYFQYVNVGVCSTDNVLSPMQYFLRISKV